MIGIKELSLQKALNAAACRELPHSVGEENDRETYWIKAIALVKKRDFTTSYCLVERGSDGLIRYTADFGSVSSIYGLVSIHPYVVVDVKRFGYAGSDDEFKAYMKRKLHLTDEDMAANSEEDWRRARIGYAIRAQEESDRRFQVTGVAEVTEVEEKGPEEPNIATHEPTAGTIIAEDGSFEQFKEISSSKDYKQASRRGRKPKK